MDCNRETRIDQYIWLARGGKTDIYFPTASPRIIPHRFSQDNTSQLTHHPLQTSYSPILQITPHPPIPNKHPTKTSEYHPERDFSCLIISVSLKVEPLMLFVQEILENNHLSCTKETLMNHTCPGLIYFKSIYCFVFLPGTSLIIRSNLIAIKKTIQTICLLKYSDWYLIGASLNMFVF